jgi:hypothetical protein
MNQPKTPIEIAADIARQIQNDPIAAAQVKEHLGEKWLLELLEILPPLPGETNPENTEVPPTVSEIPRDDLYGAEDECQPVAAWAESAWILVGLIMIVAGAFFAGRLIV